MKHKNYLGLYLVVFLTCGDLAISQPDKRFSVLAEGGLTRQSRNDVRVPNETGTQFLLPDAIGKGRMVSSELKSLSISMSDTACGSFSRRCRLPTPEHCLLTCPLPV